MTLMHAIRRAAIAAVLLPVVASAQTGPSQPSLSHETKREVLSGISRVIKNMAFVPGVDLSKWDGFIADQEPAIAKAKSNAEFADAVRTALAKFGISHMVLMTPEAAKARIERKAVGIGVAVQPQEEGLLVTTVFEDTPAKSAGLAPGDLIFEADGRKLNATSTILGDEGTKVDLKIRKIDGRVEAKTLIRKKYSNVRPETLTWVNDETAVLRVPTFDLSYNRKRVDELMGQARKAKHLVLDLRSNGGGAVLNMLHLMGYFVPAEKPFGLFVTKSLVNQYVKETNQKPTDLKKIADWAERGWLRPSKVEGGPFSGPVAVLINGGTGSASEITAAAMKEFLQCPILGSKSAGAVLVSTMAPVGSNWTFQYPLSDYITASGVRLEGNGIEPDLEVAMPKVGAPDEAVEKAVALLKRAELRAARSGGGDDLMAAIFGN